MLQRLSSLMNKTVRVAIKLPLKETRKLCSQPNYQIICFSCRTRQFYAPILQAFDTFNTTKLCTDSFRAFDLSIDLTLSGEGFFF